MYRDSLFNAALFNAILEITRVLCCDTILDISADSYFARDFDPQYLGKLTTFLKNLKNIYFSPLKIKFWKILSHKKKIKRAGRRGSIFFGLTPQSQNTTNIPAIK